MVNEVLKKTKTQNYETPVVELVVWDGDIILGTSSDVGEEYPEYWD